MRLDTYLSQSYTNYSRSVWQKCIEMGLVEVNGVVVTSVRHRVYDDDQVTFYTPPAVDYTQYTLPLLYEDEYVIVIDKPSGMLTHAKGTLTEEFSVAEYMRHRMREHDDTNRPGIVHRLDRATSGVIICAKDSQTQRLLQKQFQDRKTHKTYLAIVQGTPTIEEATIDIPIERDPRQPSRFRAHANGKPALTHYTVIATNGTYSVVELQPHTGRTHQLRVHMSYIGCPIIGDVLYGTSTSPIGRLCLHATCLEITIPPSRRMTFTAPLPDDMKTVVATIRGDDAS